MLAFSVVVSFPPSLAMVIVEVFDSFAGNYSKAVVIKENTTVQDFLAAGKCSSSHIVDFSAICIFMLKISIII